MFERFAFLGINECMTSPWKIIAHNTPAITPMKSAGMAFTFFTINVTTIAGTIKIQVGIRSGLNYSFSSGNLVESLDSRISYHVGSYLQIPTKRKKMIIETGVFYSNEGYEAGLLYGEKHLMTLYQK